ncbi:AMP-binding protein [Propionibacterium australiense]|uniref:AMP-binding enzyme n=1 Tax=Propionibacterium australiense TaxID=119981 RepID=A0A383S8F9_9ACTN|nr:AMP-binding protein [Propionibacterium australiense]RLP06997.1 O-succinylbenzoic acid--CoA ligase [Propionibacterium australiense]RLP10805.1 O-succinylbenzoic acid--CoA ligase [Propionibacterium australiense]SYZ34248.1 AMP-binding enzyme [Propionibacterium australiense]VEH89917.1 2-succinylbenzoate--CoA ligase [Propionibacterium australiense]
MPGPTAPAVLVAARTGASAGALARALEPVLAGRDGPLLMPAGPGEDIGALAGDAAARIVRQPPGARLVLRTSGSTTGRGRLVGLSGAQLRSSVEATHARLGGAGTWVLALPPHHIAGLQVLARSLVTGRSPLVVEGRATPALIGAAVRRAARQDPDGRAYISLVPTQLSDALADAEATRALGEAAAVLVGGAVTPAPLVAAARDAGLALRLSYGMSETCGGCVYDGRPLAGVRVGFGAPGVQDRPGDRDEGRVWLSGPMVMSDYLDGAPGVQVIDGARWLATSDLGSMTAGVLTVSGRTDDVIVSGGLKISAQDVAAAVLGTGLVDDCVVVGLDDARWGQVVAAAVAAPLGLDAGRLREETGRAIGRERAPRVILRLDGLPALASGKPDRAAVRALLARARADGEAWNRC